MSVSYEYVNHELPLPPTSQISVRKGTVVLDISEYTFRAPRVGLFLGDSPIHQPTHEPAPHFSLRDETIPKCSGPPFLGHFDILPLEITSQILAEVDVYSLISFRSINQRAQQLVESLRGFVIVVTFPRLLNALWELECHSHSLKRMANCLERVNCTFCGHLGDMLYLITAERWCHDCWLKQPSLEVQGASSLTEPLTEEQVTMIPHVTLSPGSYGRNGKGFLTRRRLGLDRRALQSIPKYREVEVPRIPHCKVHPLKFVAVIRGPYFDVSTGSFEEGFMCKACCQPRRTNVPWYMGPFPCWGQPWRRYTKEGMAKHLGEFGRIFRLKDGRSMRYAHENPFTAWCSFEDGGGEQILRRCRDSQVTLIQGQVYIESWDSVSSNLDCGEIKST